MASLLETVTETVNQNNVSKVNSIILDIGDMTEVVPDALQFAFEAMSPSTVLEGATMEINMIEPRSKCLDCGNVYSHDRFQMMCPKCGSMTVELLQGHELNLRSIDVDLASCDPATGEHLDQKE